MMTNQISEVVFVYPLLSDTVFHAYMHVSTLSMNTMIALFFQIFADGVCQKFALLRVVCVDACERVGLTAVNAYIV